MTISLCEETALMLYPWVFIDEEGGPKNKRDCPEYTELVDDLFKNYFDVAEELRVQLDLETIENMFVESDVELTEEMIMGTKQKKYSKSFTLLKNKNKKMIIIAFKGLTEGPCMWIRLRGRMPHESWPVPYPKVCGDEVESYRCPTREIGDIENYLLEFLEGEPSPLPERGPGLSPPPRPTYEAEGTYVQRHIHVHRPQAKQEDIDPIMSIIGFEKFDKMSLRLDRSAIRIDNGFEMIDEPEEDVERTHPPCWVPRNVRIVWEDSWITLYLSQVHNNNNNNLFIKRQGARSTCSRQFSQATWTTIILTPSQSHRHRSVPSNTKLTDSQLWPRPMRATERLWWILELSSMTSHRTPGVLPPTQTCLIKRFKIKI